MSLVMLVIFVFVSVWLSHQAFQLTNFVLPTPWLVAKWILLVLTICVFFVAPLTYIGVCVLTMFAAFGWTKLGKTLPFGFTSHDVPSIFPLLPLQVFDKVVAKFVK